MNDFIISDFHEYGNTKTSVRYKLNISMPSIYNLHDMACELVPDFLKDYPSIAGKPFTRAPLTIYQVYVLWGLIFWKRHRSIPYGALEDKLVNDFEFNRLFTKEYFLAMYPQFNHSSKTHEDERVLSKPQHN